MYRFLVAAVAIVSVMVAVWSVDAQVDKGAEQIHLDGGTQGGVAFPHRVHQDALNDCMVCHQAFAQSSGSIQKAKAEGTLAKKQVMNKLCIQCHRTEKKAGNKAGPTTCGKCHIKEKE